MRTTLRHTCTTHRPIAIAQSLRRGSRRRTGKRAPSSPIAIAQSLRRGSRRRMGEARSFEPGDLVVCSGGVCTWRSSESGATGEGGRIERCCCAYHTVTRSMRSRSRERAAWERVSRVRA